MEVEATLGSRIATARGHRPKADIARALGVDVKTVYRWENDQSQPEAKQIAPLADALGVSERWLLRGEPEPEHVKPTGTG